MNVIINIENSITKIINNLNYEVDHVSLKPSSRPDLGDYQINEAMMLGKKYGKSPRDVAEEIVKELSKDSNFTNINIAGPGFINITLSESCLINSLNYISNIKENNIDYPQKRRILIDYGGANVAKELHVGHLRSANIGEALKRLSKLLGNDVIGDVHLGDWGLPLGLVLKQIKEEQPSLIYFDESYTGPYPDSSPVTPQELARLYPLASKRKSEDEEYLKDAQDITNKIQSGVPGYRALWKHVVETSKVDIKEVYDELNTNFDLWLGESDADASVEKVVNIFEEKKLSKLDNGALIVEVKEETDKKEIPPILLVKSNGTAGYQTTEIATLYNRMKDYELTDVWYLTDARQSLHFLQSFRAAKLSGIVPKDVNLEHLPFGTINGNDGKPFKTRDGGVMSLKCLINIVYQATLKKMNRNIVAEEDLEKTARMIAIDSIKYADLLPFRTTDYIFDPEKFSDLEGKTAPYLLYSTIRMKSLLNKAKEQNIIFDKYTRVNTDTEKQIILTLLDLPRILLNSYNSRSMNDISEYIYNITSIYNKFYSENKVLSCEDEDIKKSWLFISNVVYNVNMLLLDVMGLKVPEKM